MQFELLKTDKVTVDIDFKKIYDTVVKELEVKENDYDEHDDYAYVICDYFDMNMDGIMEELFGIYTYANKDAIYCCDREANEIVFDKITYAFEDYVYNKGYEN